MKKEWNAVEILRHSRHDWLNKLQLIKGNIALNRMDRVSGIIDEIIVDTQNESKLTNLKADQFAGYLMMFNWNPHHFVLEFEVVGAGDLSHCDAEICSWCSDFFNKLDEAVQPFGENHLNMSIQLSDQDVRFFFDFSGIIESEDTIINFIDKQAKHSTVNILEYKVHKDEMLVIVKVMN